jgi:manganese/iron transport system permease protein
LGIYLSFFIDSAPAPTIILILTSFFIVAFIKQSLIARQISNQIKYQKER